MSEKLQTLTPLCLLRDSTFHHMAGSLHLTTSKRTERYQRTTVIETVHMSIELGMFTLSGEPAPSYLPPNWSAHVHPEGQLYFYRYGAPRVVTEANIYDPNVMEKVNYWIDDIQECITAKQITLSDDVELFLEIDENDGSYYFVDHISHTEFWLQDVDTQDIGLPAAASPSHLRLILQELYWTHVEYFPMHRQTITLRVMDDLVGVFSHARADQLTSRNSTFPYNESECAKFLELLSASRDSLNDGNVTCLVARLWHLVFAHRFSTHYGEHHARLSRDQAILKDTARESRRVGALTSSLSFGTSKTYLNRMNDIYTDHLVYVHQWQPFMRQCLKDWKSSSLLAFGFTMLHLLLANTPTYRPLTIFSLLCFGSSIIVSLFLVNRHETLEDATALEALRYLKGVRSVNFKFQLVAFAYALPKALFFWGLAALVMNALMIAAAIPGGIISWPWCFMALLFLSLLALVALQDITSGKKILKLPTFFRQKRVDLEVSAV